MMLWCHNPRDLITSCTSRFTPVTAVPAIDAQVQGYQSLVNFNGTVLGTASIGQMDKYGPLGKGFRVLGGLCPEPSAQ